MIPAYSLDCCPGQSFPSSFWEAYNQPYAISHILNNVFQYPPQFSDIYQLKQYVELWAPFLEFRPTHPLNQRIQRLLQEKWLDAFGPEHYLTLGSMAITGCDGPSLAQQLAPEAWSVVLVKLLDDF